MVTSVDPKSVEEQKKKNANAGESRWLNGGVGLSKKLNTL